MTTIQIIVDQDGALTGLTCNDLTIEHPVPTNYNGPIFTTAPHEFRFTASNVIRDNSFNLISLPDELLLRIRDHNIDEERKFALTQTQKLKEKIESLKDQVRGWELRRDLAKEEWERYDNAIDKIIDKYPEVAAEIALEDGDLDAACYFAKKANEENENEI